jgi:hypothetical protein
MAKESERKVGFVGEFVVENGEHRDRNRRRALKAFKKKRKNQRGVKQTGKFFQLIEK